MNEQIINKIKAGGFTRTEMLTLRNNAEIKAKNGNLEAQEIVETINSTAVPELQAEYVFMGFCPGADFENRLDLDWIERGLCTFDFIESEHQLKRFADIMVGDTMILKKRQEFGKTMLLFGHGKVKELRNRKSDGLRYLMMDWSKQNEILEVPLMGCNSTVDVRSLAVVEKELHEDFWKWLGTEKPTKKTGEKITRLYEQ
jgi:hypothetical protein